jgi:hypothetical protein
MSKLLFQFGMVITKKKTLLNKIQIRNKTISHICFRFLILIFLITNSFNSEAQDQSAKKSWNFTIAPYLMFPFMNGDVAVKGIPVNISARAGDIFNNLDFAFMIYSEASNEKWAITLDALYMKLSARGTTPLASREADFEMNQLAITPTVMYRLASWAEAGIGGRINSIGSSVKVAPGDYILPGTDFSENVTWFDPIIVARVMQRFGDNKWRLGLYADIGGFGIGSKFTWQVYPFAGYQFGKLFEIDLAWRWLGINYEKGSETDYFLYDMVISGPEIGFLFHF